MVIAAAPPPVPALPAAQTPVFHTEAVDELGGARAIEVAAMLGDSVVDVKHCMDPKGGKVTPHDLGPGRRSASRAC